MNAILIASVVGIVLGWVIRGMHRNGRKLDADVDLQRRLGARTRQLAQADEIIEDLTAELNIIKGCKACKPSAEYERDIDQALEQAERTPDLRRIV